MWPKGSPSPLAPAPPEGVVLHAVSTYDAKRRKLGRGGKSFCLVAVWPMGNSFSLSGVCDDRGQHAADAVAAAREPCIERSM